MKSLNLVVSLLLTLGMTGTLLAQQLPMPTEEHKLLKQEEGEWNAEVTMYMGPTGPYPEPHVSTGKESNRMIGDFWLVSDFSGDFGGMPFTGHAQGGYDAEKQKYFSVWIDSFSPHATKMLGTYDADTTTMTYETKGMGMDGKPSKGKTVIVYDGPNKRTMTMYMAMPGQDELVKVMEIDYTRANGDS